MGYTVIKTKHNKTMCIFCEIYCSLKQKHNKIMCISCGICCNQNKTQQNHVHILWDILYSKQNTTKPCAYLVGYRYTVIKIKHYKPMCISCGIYCSLKHIEAETWWPPFPDDIFKYIFPEWKFRSRFHWSLFPSVQLTIFHHWLR